MSKKRVLIVATTALLGSLGSFASAAAGENQYTPLKQGLTFSSAALAGAALGGPFGLVAGALGGAYLGEQIERADEVKAMSEVLAQANSRAENLTRELAANGAKSAQIHQFALDILTSQILFASGSDQLSGQGRARIDALAKVLLAYPEMRVRLDGYADPRGTDEYNNVLAHYRADSVRAALIEAGVSREHIELHSHGASGSLLPQADQQVYAAARRVEIRVTHPRRDALVMN